MIGQFTSRFVGGLKTYQVMLAMMVIPSIPIAAWFSVLYHYHSAGIPTEGITNLAMVCVGVVFVINSLDSLIRLYTDNLNMTVERHQNIAERKQNRLYQDRKSQLIKSITSYLINIGSL